MTELLVETRINAPQAACFDLYLDIEEHCRSTAHTGAAVVAGKAKGQHGLGEDVTYRARHLGITWKLTSRVVELDWPHRFVDEMVAGPFKAMRHEHEFGPMGDSTLVKERMILVAPLGPLGWLAERLFLARYMRSLMRTRAEYLKRRAEEA